jgi:hypothetical protein
MVRDGFVNVRTHILILGLVIMTRSKTKKSMQLFLVSPFHVSNVTFIHLH